MAKTDKKNGGDLGFEAELFKAADKLRGNMEPSDYKHVVLGLIFLKYISDAFDEKHKQLMAEDASAAEDRDEYAADNVFWVPKEARWSNLQANAKQPTIGTLIDDAMRVIEKDNESLKGVLPKDYARPALNKIMLGELIDLISKIDLMAGGEHRSKDVLGRVYEYFLGRFAGAEGKGGGEFYTPRSVVRTLVEMLEPYSGRIYDPCCGSGGMFVQSENFVREHGGRIGDIAVYGQESNNVTWRLAKMNLAVRGIDSDIRWNNEGSFHKDELRDLKFDYILANPPFNISDWGGERIREDVRWKYGAPPASNANYAWLQHIIHHLAPNGVAGVVLANGSMSSNQNNEGLIRRQIIEADLVECMVALPGHLFYTMYSPVCLWFLNKNKNAKGRKDRRQSTLFIDARNLGTMQERTHRILDDEDVKKIVDTYQSWAHDDATDQYEDTLGFCRVAQLDEIRAKKYNLTPARYVGSEMLGLSDEPVDASITKLCTQALPLASAAAQKAEEIMNLLGKFSNIQTASEGIDAYQDISLIDINNKLNRLLNLSAETIFRSFFIDFDPVYANSQRELYRFPSEVLEIFPSEFEDSPLGEIPKGWRVGTYAELIRPRSERIGDVIAPEFSATVRGLEPRELRFNKQLAKATSKNKRIKKNDLVFGLSRRVISFGLMTEAEGSVSPVYEVFEVDCDKCSPHMLEMYIRFYMSSHMDILKPGAREGQPVDRDYLLSKEVLIPDIRVQKYFERMLFGNLN